VKISVITVCYNSESCIENAVKSVMSQTYKDVEYIIIDGKSTDKTLELLSKYKHNISKIISEKDTGIYDAMNKGIEHATGDIIYFLNSDDYLYDKNVLRDVVSVFIKDEKLLLVYGDVIYQNSENDTRELRSFRHVSRKNLLYENLCHQAVFARRSLFREIGCFDISYKIVADYDWLLKVFNSFHPRVFNFNRIIAVFTYGGMHVKFAMLAKEERLNVKQKYVSKQAYFVGELFYKLRNKFLKAVNAFEKAKI